MIDDYKYLYKPLYMNCIQDGIIDFFCVLGSWFIDIDTYLYGIPFKDDSEGVVSYSLGEVIWDFSLVGVGWVLESWLQVKMP